MPTALERAARAVERRRWPEALAALLEAWRARRAPRLADLIEAVSPRAATEHPRVRERELHALWLEVAARRQPADLAWLLPRLTVGERAASRITERARLLAARGDDPRLARQLSPLLQTMPLRTMTSRPFWDTVLQLIERNGDRRCLPALQGAGDAQSGQKLPAALSRWLAPRVARVIATLEARQEPDLSAEEAACCAGMDAALGPRSAESLLAQILAHPEQDEPRLVYADLLQEQGDPRGEFITLQYQRHRGQGTPAGMKREWQLFRQHYKAWLGPLVQVVDKRGFNQRQPPPRPPFERGFLARCRVKPPSETALQQVLGDPHWATVEQLTGHDTPYRLALQPGMVSLRSTLLAWDHLAALARVTQPRPLEALTVWGFSEGLSAQELRPLLACGPKLPRLEALELRGQIIPDRGLSGLHPRALDPLLAEPLGQQLRRLTVAINADMMGEWQRYLERSKLRQLTLNTAGMVHGFCLRFERSDGGALDRLFIAPRDAGPAPGNGLVVEALRSVDPGDLARIELAIAPDDALQQALARFGQAEVVVRS